MHAEEVVALACPASVAAGAVAVAASAPAHCFVELYLAAELLLRGIMG